MIPTIEQIKKGLGQTPIYPTKYPISQGFGKENTYSSILSWYTAIGMLGHNGIDYGCPKGTRLVAPIDFTVSNFNYADQDPNGYGTTLWGRSKPFIVDGVTYAIEIIFGHLTDFIAGIGLGKEYKQGADCCISGNTGLYTTGPHLHQGWRVVQLQTNGGWLAINKDNGYKGYFDQLLLMKKTMLIVKTVSSPHHYLIQGNKRIMLVDLPVLTAFSEATIQTIDQSDMDKYQDGGTLVWVERIIN